MTFKSVNRLKMNNPNKVLNAQLINTYGNIYKNSHSEQKLLITKKLISSLKQIYNDNFTRFEFPSNYFIYIYIYIPSRKNKIRSH